MLSLCDFADKICYPVIGYKIAIGSPALKRSLPECTVPETIVAQLIHSKNYPLPTSRRMAGHHYLFMGTEAAKFECESSLNGQE